MLTTKYIALILKIILPAPLIFEIGRPGTIRMRATLVIMPSTPPTPQRTARR